jgi:phosphatidate phosphatase APP1
LGQFHVTVYVTNPRSAHIATEAMLDRTLIAMSSDIDEDVIVTGFVQSIEEDPRSAMRFWKMQLL